MLFASITAASEQLLVLWWWRVINCYRLC